jgi:nucleotide-binding universal stress UspA family protein
MKRRMSIVCATDFSPLAGRAADVAAALAVRFKDTVRLVHVLQYSGLESNEILQQLEKSARSSLLKEAQRLRMSGAAVEEVFSTGSIHEALITETQRQDVRLLLIGALGHKAAERWLLGSVAERAAESAPVPAIVLRHADPIEAWLNGTHPLNVFIAVDFTQASEASLHWARQLREMGHCNITVAHVDWPPQHYGAFGIRHPISFAENPEIVQRALEAELNEMINTHLGGDLVKTIVQAGWGRTDAHLIHLAQQGDADLIVVGARQRHGLERLGLGSVSRALLHHAASNIAIVPVPNILPATANPIPTLRRALVATDFSELGNCALPYAYSVVASGGTVFLLHVLSPSKPARIATSRDQRRDRVAPINQLKSLIPDAASANKITTKVEVVESDNISEAICHAAERNRADVICMGSHGRTGFRRVILGSVAQGVLANAKRPLFIVRSRCG